MQLKEHMSYMVRGQEMYFLSSENGNMIFYHYVETIRGREIMYFMDNSLRKNEIEPVKGPMINDQKQAKAA